MGSNGGIAQSVFQTERLYARPWSLEHDLESALAIYGDPEVMRYLGAAPSPVPDLESMKERLASRLAMPQPQGAGFWALVEREGDALVGAMIFKDTPDGDGVPTGDYEIGWHLRRASWGKGYASEAARELIAYAFSVRPDLDRLIAIAYPQNLASLRVMAKAGMSPVGMTDAYYGIPTMMYEVRKR